VRLALKLLRTSLIHRSGLGQDVDPASVFIELHLAVFEREQGPIAADAHVFAGDKFAAALADNDASGGDKFAAKCLDAQAFADAIASVANAALSFFMCHKFSFRRLGCFDFFDFNDRQLLAVPDGLVITFAALHLESELLFTALMFHDVGDDAGAGHGRAAYDDFIAANHENPVKSEGLARLGVEAFDFQRVARGDTILFAASFKDCVHKISRKGLNIKPDFSLLSTPDFQKISPGRRGAIGWLPPHEGPRPTGAGARFKFSVYRQVNGLTSGKMGL